MAAAPPAPPPYGAPPPGYGAPPPGYAAPPPYGAPPPGYGAPPPGYVDPAMGYVDPMTGQPMMVQSMPSRLSGMAIAGFILSFICGLLGLIFSIIGLNQINASGGMLRGRGLAVAGIIISILSMVVGVGFRACNSGGRSYYRYRRAEIQTETPRRLAAVPLPPAVARL